jgi:hypothetical protein
LLSTLRLYLPQVPVQGLFVFDELFEQKHAIDERHL